MRPEYSPLEAPVTTGELRYNDTADHEASDLAKLGYRYQVGYSMSGGRAAMVGETYIRGVHNAIDCNRGSKAGRPIDYVQEIAICTKDARFARNEFMWVCGRAVGSTEFPPQFPLAFWKREKFFLLEG
jgi:hypothetical protein